GAVALFAVWHDAFPHWGECAWWSLFHAVSAFCNAGLSLWDNSLHAWVDRPDVWGIFVVLIRLGSLGFFVLVDLAGSWVGPGGNGPRAVWRRLHTQTKVVLTGMLLLDVVGFALFWLLENKGVLALLPQGARAQAALFQSITLRSAGLQTISLEELSASTALLCSLWMFIGAAPGSTGGGVKITTVVIAAVAVRALLSEQGEVQLFGRRVAGALVNRSLVIVLLAVGVVVTAVFILATTENFPLRVLLFEAVSAGTTTGLSMGVTSQLTSVGQFVLIGMMFIGRIGPLTLALAVGEREKPVAYRYPLTRIAVG
ncbi:MAG: potassium transporter TrkG, partial [Myxococcota bacterium]